MFGLDSVTNLDIARNIPTDPCPDAGHDIKMKSLNKAKDYCRALMACHGLQHQHQHIHLHNSTHEHALTLNLLTVFNREESPHLVGPFLV